MISRNFIISTIGNAFRAPARHKSFIGRSELDSHADTMVAGKHYTLWTLRMGHAPFLHATRSNINLSQEYRLFKPQQDVLLKEE